MAQEFLGVPLINKSVLGPALILLIAIALLGLGLKDQQFLETMWNGARLCLPCIGIQ